MTKQEITTDNPHRGNEMDKNSDTPRTDAAMFDSDYGSGHPFELVDADFARTLERDLSAAQKRVQELEGALTDIDVICNESPFQTRKRMGTRIGNILATARAALKDKS